MQDYLVWANQGPIAKRHLEKLGESDRGVIMFRRQLMEQLELTMAGHEPTINVFRDPAMNRDIEVPIEHVRPRGARYVPTEPGYSRDKEKIEAVMATWASLQQAATPTAG
jgi:hypothetical protein